MPQPNFFDVQADLAARRRGAKPAPAAGAAEPLTVTQLTVTQLTGIIEKAIKSGVPGGVLVRGEVSNCNLHRASGHLYFTLKDAGACINCVMWKDAAARLKFKVGDGMELIAGGSVRVFAPQGKYQLYVSSLQPVGQGALELAFRQLHARLAAEGLFAAERKRPVPRYPRGIAMVTSQSTAALQDMLKVLRPFAWLRLYVYHVPVQGEGSAEKIAAAIDHLSRCAADIGGVDLVLLARGGGSLEDLWAFNEECVARAVVASRIPIITGIGHEVDISIADLAADYHAHTPTEAARVAAAFWKDAPDLLDQHSLSLRRNIRQRLADARQRLLAIERHEAFRRPMDRVNDFRQLLDQRQQALAAAMTALAHRLQRRLADGDSRLALGMHQRLRHATARLAAVAGRVEQCHPRHAVRLNRLHLSELDARLHRVIRQRWHECDLRLTSLSRYLQAVAPEQVLRRGYTITTLKKPGTILRSVAGLSGGERIVTRFSDGQIESITEDPQQPRLFE